MNKLMVYDPRRGSLDRDQIKLILSNFDEIRSIQDSPDEFACLSAYFAFGEENNRVELRKECDLLILGREGEAALELAFRIQKQYPTGLHLVDENYSLDLAVGDFADIAAFKKAALKILNTAG